MKERIFDECGHITEDGFYRIRSAGVEPLQRLMVAEHMATCQRCSLRLSESFKEEELLIPFPGFSDSVMKKCMENGQIKKGRRNTLYNYQVVIAASLAILFLYSGIFSGLLSSKTYLIELSNTRSVSISDILNQKATGVSERLLQLEVFNHD